MSRVRIHYHRPPAGLEVYEQILLHDGPDVKVTLMPSYPQPTVRIGAQILLEEGAPALWFTFPGAWHDIGRFHRADGTVTGLYANILTPVEFRPEGWETIDLFLDLWLPEQGEPLVLDREEFERSVTEGWIDREAAARAREEIERLQASYRRGAWPPKIVRTFPFERPSP